MKTPRIPATNPGFTLVELLVVLAIISLLIVILLPVLGAARESARSVACLSNQRQLGIAFAAYTNQYDDVYPPYSNENDLGETEYWAGMMYQEGTLSTGAIFSCPNFDATPDAGFDQTALATHPAHAPLWFVTEYGYNYRQIGSTISLPGTSAQKYVPAKTFEIKNPSQTLLIMDSFSTYHEAQAGETRGYYIVWDSGWTDLSIPDARHANALNVLWVDGHASAIAIKDRANPYDELTKFAFTGSNLWDRE